MRTRTGVRVGVAVLVGLAATLLIGSPASAHVQVTADKTQAGATNVTVTFTGEAESTTGGIASEQVYLPAGITPQQVQLVSAPTGWTLTKGTDNVTVGGAALPTGTDAEFALLIAQFPADASQLVFKTIETYSNGEISRWIDLQQPGQAEPKHPAPTLALTGAAGGQASSAPATAAAATPATTPDATNAATTADPRFIQRLADRSHCGARARRAGHRRHGAPAAEQRLGRLTQACRRRAACFSGGAPDKVLLRTTRSHGPWSNGVC